MISCTIKRDIFRSFFPNFYKGTDKDIDIEPALEQAKGDQTIAYNRARNPQTVS